MQTLSFNGNKTITTGQGGAVLGDNPDLEWVVRHLANVAKTDKYEHDAIGFNYRMANLNAAMGCAQMERLREFIDRKQAVWGRYRESLPMLATHSAWMSIAKIGHDKIPALREKDIDARPFWKPLHLQEPYQGCAKTLLGNTNALWQKLVCLPCSVSLTEEQQDRVIEACVSLQ
jgi:dTDP-4-amino-4,6-dideoxygalactose transaminase